MEVPLDARAVLIEKNWLLEGANPFKRGPAENGLRY